MEIQSVSSGYNFETLLAISTNGNRPNKPEMVIEEFEKMLFSMMLEPFSNALGVNESDHLLGGMLKDYAIHEMAGYFSSHFDFGLETLIKNEMIKRGV